MNTTDIINTYMTKEKMNRARRREFVASFAGLSLRKKIARVKEVEAGLIDHEPTAEPAAPPGSALSSQS